MAHEAQPRQFGHRNVPDRGKHRRGVGLRRQPHGAADATTPPLQDGVSVSVIARDDPGLADETPATFPGKAQSMPTAQASDPLRMPRPRSSDRRRNSMPMRRARKTRRLTGRRSSVWDWRPVMRALPEATLSAAE
jgi:hypothetical protein